MIIFLDLLKRSIKYLVIHNQNNGVKCDKSIIIETVVC